jgi:uncharacterized protein
LDDKVIKIPFKENIYIETETGIALIGGQCKRCHLKFFPKVPFCSRCFNEEVETINLSRKGTLYSYSVCRTPVGNIEVPFAAAWIKLTEGILIFSLLKGWENHKLIIGTDVELIEDVLWVNNEGKQIFGYKFVPVEHNITNSKETG